MLSELPFYEELNVIKTNHVFRGYAMSYKVETIEKKDSIKQLQATKSSIKDLFSDLLKSDSHISKKFLFICFNESPLKIMKNAFYSILKALFILKIFKFLSSHFGDVEETA